MEVWEGVELPAPIPIREAEGVQVHVDINRRAYRGCRGDPTLPVVSIRIERKEAA